MSTKLFEKITVIAVFLGTYSFVFLLFMAQYPEWWIWTVPEQTPLAWLQSMMLILIGITSFYNFIHEKNKEKFKWFLIYSLAFFYLAFDERFALHERVRDAILIPMNFKIPFLPWVKTGDYILIIFMILGLILLKKFLKLYRENKLSLVFFIAGVIISAVAVMVDSVDLHNTSLMCQRVQQFSEEIIELTAMNCFFSAAFIIQCSFVKNEKLL